MTSDLTPQTLDAYLREMTTRLLIIARSLTYNVLAADCRYLLSEITDSQASFTERDRFAWLSRQGQVPRQLADIMPEVLRHYDSFYDINLYIHQAHRRVTIIDIRYYSRTSLPADYRQRVAHRAPMLHAKVAMPYWVSQNNQKFDINWKVYAPISPVRRRVLTLKWYLLACLYKIGS